MLNALMTSKEEMKAMEIEANELGLTLNRIETAKIEMMNDSVTKASKAMTGFANIILQIAAPGVKFLADNFTQFAKVTISNSKDTSQALYFIRNVLADVANAVQVLWGAWNGLRYVFESMVKTQAQLLQGMLYIAKKVPGANELLGLDDLDASLNDFIKETDKAADAAAESFMKNFVGVVAGSTEQWGDSVLNSFDDIIFKFGEAAKDIADVQDKAIKAQRAARPEQFDGKKNKKEKDDKVGTFAQFDRALLDVRTPANSGSNQQKVTDEENLKENRKQTELLAAMVTKIPGMLGGGILL